MMQGVYTATKKDGSTYYRVSITYNKKHVSIGSYENESDAHSAYLEAKMLYEDTSITLLNYQSKTKLLSNDKIITILNHRDHKMYIKTPIYLRGNYFSYFLDYKTELKFDNDDLFYYSSHRILKRQGHLYVNDYGMQYSILDRYGIKAFAVSGKDYTFANGDSLDFRYSNVIVINKYHGVSKIDYQDTTRFLCKIHLNGDFIIGRFRSEEKAAVAYNKAVDFARDHGFEKDFIENYVLEYTAKEYADVYTDISLPDKYIKYIETITAQ